nr:hypothetical protein GCM10010200_081750 [Actinomadura rugatobispora]
MAASCPSSGLSARARGPGLSGTALIPPVSRGNRSHKCCLQSSPVLERGSASVNSLWRGHLWRAKWEACHSDRSAAGLGQGVGRCGTASRPRDRRVDYVSTARLSHGKWSFIYAELTLHLSANHRCPVGVGALQPFGSGLSADSTPGRLKSAEVWPLTA